MRRHQEYFLVGAGSLSTFTFSHQRSLDDAAASAPVHVVYFCKFLEMVANAFPNFETTARIGGDDVQILFSIAFTEMNEC